MYRGRLAGFALAATLGLAASARADLFYIDVGETAVPGGGGQYAPAGWLDFLFLNGVQGAVSEGYVGPLGRVPAGVQYLGAPPPGHGPGFVEIVDITFNPWDADDPGAQPNEPAVWSFTANAPEPTGWTLMIAGLGLIGYALRTLRQQKA